MSRNTKKRGEKSSHDLTWGDAMVTKLQLSGRWETKRGERKRKAVRRRGKGGMTWGEMARFLARSVRKGAGGKTGEGQRGGAGTLGPFAAGY